ncbi:MAG: NAD-dependent epimerase/dehydratase family protein [Cyclobacteriaceae bacterium]
MKIAITGSNGFLGSHLAKVAVNAGHETIALIRPGADLRNLPDNRKLIIEPIDYKDLCEINKSISQLKAKYGKIDVLIHNAGLTVSSTPEAYFDVNSTLTKTLIQAVVSHDWLTSSGKWFQISSYAAAGPEGSSEPISYYGRSKLEAEKHVKNSNLDHIIFRPTGIYGSGDLAFLPLFNAAKWGVYPMLAPTDQRITLIHGFDVASFVIGQIGELKKNKTYHLNDGQVYSHSDFKRALEHAFGKRLRTVKLPTRIVKLFLKINDAIALRSKQSTGLTLEKYNEISESWDLKTKEELHHPKLTVNYDIKKGFVESHKYYKSLNLI